MAPRLSDYWRHYYSLPFRHGGSPFADFSQNQSRITTTSVTSTVPELASQLTNLLFGHSENSASSSAPASMITNGILANQLQALAQGLQTLALWRPIEPTAPDEANP